MVFKERILILFLIFLTFISSAYTDCGCGQRCIKYSSDLQCTRCCTATVRRSVPVIPPDEVIDSNNAKVYDTELSQPVDRPQYYIIPRSSRLTSSSHSISAESKIPETLNQSALSNAEVLSRIIANLSIEERRVRSSRRRRILQKAKERLQFYQRLKLKQDSTQVSSGEMEMFDLLEMILSRIRISRNNNYRI